MTTTAICNPATLAMGARLDRAFLIMQVIDSFSGRYRFLSNFYPSPIEYEGLQCATVEHGFQAKKAVNPGERAFIANSHTPGIAKRLGRACNRRKDWEQIKRGVMLDLLRLKFRDSRLRTLLIGTGDAKLIEGNTWGDRFWGTVNGEGENHLGQLLMLVRAECAAEDEL